MDTPEILRRLKPWKDRQRRTAWVPEVRDGAGPSQFGGTPWTGPGAPWPACGICDEPLTPCLQLDLDALPPDLAGRHGSGLLQLFYCVGDDCQGEGGWEPFGDTLSHVRIVRPSGPPAPAPKDVELHPARRIVAWTPFADYPGPEEHKDLGLSYAFDFKAKTVRVRCEAAALEVVSSEIDELPEQIAQARDGDKLGGWPHWVQGVEYPSCPRCARRMVLLVQVDSEDHVPFMWGDAGCAHVTQCPEHKEIVAFAWACG